MEESLNNTIQYYSFYLLSVIIFVLSLISYNIYLIAMCSLTLLFAAVIFQSGHIVNNFLIKRSKIIEINNGYKLSNNLTSISKRLGKSYISISVAVLRLKNETGFKGESIQELVESLKEPFELSISLTEIDKKRITESLETKRRLKEITLSRTKPTSYDKINNLRRQIETISSEISNIEGGNRSFDVSIKLKAISKSESEYESEFTSSKNIELLANKFSAMMGLEYEIIKGEELLNII